MVNPFDIFEYLPHSNCQRCGKTNCMAFAQSLAEGSVRLSACAPLRLPEQENYRLAIEKMLYQ